MNYIYLSFVNLISSRFKDEDLELFDLDLEVFKVQDEFGKESIWWLNVNELLELDMFVMP